MQSYGGSCMQPTGGAGGGSGSKGHGAWTVGRRERAWARPGLGLAWLGIAWHFRTETWSRIGHSGRRVTFHANQREGTNITRVTGNKAKPQLRHTCRYAPYPYLAPTIPPFPPRADRQHNKLERYSLKHKRSVQTTHSTTPVPLFKTLTVAVQ